MSWLNSLLPFAAGFVKGFVSEYTHSEPAGRLSSPHYYDFPQHMAALAEATGLQLTSLHERRASFILPFRGGQYIATAVLAGDRIAVAEKLAGGADAVQSRAQDRASTRREVFP